jgi:hypothetical protein
MRQIPKDQSKMVLKEEMFISFEIRGAKGAKVIRIITKTQ